MRPETEAKLRKIKRISTILRVVCKVIVALNVLGFVVATVDLAANRGRTVGYNNITFPMAELSPGARLVLIAAVALTAGVSIKCFYHFHALLGNYSREEIFTRDSARQIRQLGIACVMWGGIAILWAILPRAISAVPPNPVHGNADAAVIGAIIIVISWFMEMAAELREENELTI